MKRFLCALSTLTFTCLLQAQSLQDALARMDKAAPGIHAMTAQVKMTTYTAVIDDQSVEDGTLRMQKTKGGDVRAVVEFKGASDARTVALLGRLVEIYYPNLNQYQKYDLGKQGETADQLLLLGFGTSGSDLAKSYEITRVKSETVGAQDTDELELTPKDPAVRAKLAKVDLWIPVNAGYPIQQQFFDPPKPGNWRIVTYSDVSLNPDIPGTLDLKLPKGAKKQSE